MLPYLFHHIMAPSNLLIAQIPSFMRSLLPVACYLCGMKQTSALCSSCNLHYFRSQRHQPRCITCGLPTLSNENYCGQCLQRRPAFDHTIVACDYVAPLDQLILALKFGHRLAVATPLAELLAQSILADKSHPLPDLFIPVPLSRARLTLRGFNQALEIAKPLAKQLALPLYSDLLVRVRDTEQQSRLHPDERQQNIRYAFSPNQRYRDKIRGKHFGVVDDVMTTGATMNEIAACLKRHGATRITNVVFARTPPH